jgi:predicted glycosyltransferase
MSVPASIAIEAETVGDPRTMFRLRIDGKVVGENLTAVQTHLLVGEILERIVLPEKARKPARALEASDNE